MVECPTCGRSLEKKEFGSPTPHFYWLICRQLCKSHLIEDGDISHLINKRIKLPKEEIVLGDDNG